MGILSFLGLEDEKEEQTTAPAPAANSGQSTAINSTMTKMNSPSNLSGGRRRKSKKHHKGKRATKRHRRRHN